MGALRQLDLPELMPSTARNQIHVPAPIAETAPKRSWTVTGNTLHSEKLAFLKGLGYWRTRLRHVR